MFNSLISIKNNLLGHIDSSRAGVKSKEVFMIFALFLFPISSLVRALLSQSDSSVKLAVCVFFIFINLFFIFLLTFSIGSLDQRLISSVISFFRQNIAQQLLFCCLWIEQFLLLHPLILFLYFASFSYLYLSSYDNFIFILWFILQLFFIVGSTYVRLRQSVLNKQAFEEVGLSSKDPYEWNAILAGLNSVFIHKIPLHARQSITAPIQNRIRGSNHVTFPFFFSQFPIAVT